jgi:NAD(P)H-hydrate epimerase
MAVPGATGWESPPSEVYARLLPASGWAEQALVDSKRCRAVVLGPGLGTGEDAATGVRAFLARAPQPVVVDADALTSLWSAAPAILKGRPGPTVLTPHEGEFERLAGRAPGPDRIGDVRGLAVATGSIVLLKGPTTVVAAPDGRVLLAAAGSPALGTAGTGDVLAGVIAAFVARGTDPFLAAAVAAHAHGAAARAGDPGLVAGDLVELVPRWLAG